MSSDCPLLYDWAVIPACLGYLSCKLGRLRLCTNLIRTLRFRTPPVSVNDLRDSEPTVARWIHLPPTSPLAPGSSHFFQGNPIPDGREGLLLALAFAVICSVVFVVLYLLPGILYVRVVFTYFSLFLFCFYLTKRVVFLCL